MPRPFAGGSSSPAEIPRSSAGISLFCRDLKFYCWHFHFFFLKGFQVVLLLKFPRTTLVFTINLEYHVSTWMFVLPRSEWGIYRPAAYCESYYSRPFIVSFVFIPPRPPSGLRLGRNAPHSVFRLHRPPKAQNRTRFQFLFLAPPNLAAHFSSASAIKRNQKVIPEDGAGGRNGAGGTRAGMAARRPLRRSVRGLLRRRRPPPRPSKLPGCHRGVARQLPPSACWQAAARAAGKAQSPRLRR